MADFWVGRVVFVTGAMGLLGGWLVRLLIARGATVVALVRNSDPRSLLVRDGWLDRIVSVRGELSDGALIRRTLAEYSVDTVFHLAAQTLVDVAKANPAGTLETNVRGAWTVLDACRLAGVNRIVMASSGKASTPLAGDGSGSAGPYEVSKACTEMIAAMYATTFGLPVVCLRSGNLFGGGDLNFSRLIPGVIQATLRGEPFQIRGDGRPVRDFLYVEDAAEAYISAAECLPSARGESLYIGPATRLAVSAAVGKVLGMMGRTDLRPSIQHAVPEEVAEQPLQEASAAMRLNWSPRQGFDCGLEHTIAWYRELFVSEASHQTRFVTA